MRFILCLGALLATGCQMVSGLDYVAQRQQQLPQSAVVLGTVAKATPSGLVGSESGKGSALRFDTEMVDKLTPEMKALTGWDKGMPRPMRFSFTLPSDDVVMPGHYALTRVTDALGFTSNFESARQYFRPVWFDVAPGEVVYIGDIRFAPEEKGVRIIVTDRWDEYVRTHHVPPALMARVQKRILRVPEVLPVVTEDTQNW